MNRLTDEDTSGSLSDTLIRAIVVPPSASDSAIAEAAHAAYWTEVDREAA